MKKVWQVTFSTYSITIEEVKYTPDIDLDQDDQWISPGDSQLLYFSATLDGAKSALKKIIREQSAHFQDAAKRLGLGEL